MKGLRSRRSLILSVCMFLLTAVCLCGFGASAQAAGVSASKVKKQADKIIKKQTKKISKKDKAARLERILQYADRSFAFAQRADSAFIEAARDHMLSDKNLRSAAYRPYYLYRQKHMSGAQENTGYCLEGTASIYNVRIMDEHQRIIALGAGGISKAYDPKTRKLERVANVTNQEIYVQRIDEMLQRKKDKLFV